MTLSHTQIIQHLRQLEPSRFEQFLADIWERRGWDADVTTESHDRGVDVIATKNDPYPEKVLIQAKRYQAGNRVGSREIREYNSLRDQQERVDQVLVVTTSDFTEEAQSIATDLNVKCIDGATLAQLVEDAGGMDVLNHYSRRKRQAEPDEIEGEYRTDQENGNSLRCVGTDVAAELLGMESVNFSKSSDLSLGDTCFEGIFVAFSLSVHGLSDGIWLPIDDQAEVVFTDRYTYEHTPIEISEKPLASGWQTHDPTVRTREGDRNINVDVRIESDTKYLAAVELPKFGDVKRSERINKVKQIEISPYDLRFNLDGTISKVNRLPRDIRRSLVSVRGVDFASKDA